MQSDNIHRNHDHEHEESMKHARSIMFREGTKGSFLLGIPAVGVHLYLNRFSEWYKRRFYIQGKAFWLSSVFVAGFWIYGEHAFREHINEQAQRDGATR